MQIDATRSCSTSKELLDSLFAKADTNGDKSLSVDEFSALISGLLSNNAPADNAQRPTDEQAQENEAAKAAAFAQFDSDSDGKISEAEMKAGLDQLAKSLTDAVNAHNAGDSTSLVELLFGKQEIGGADKNASAVAGIGTTGTDMSTAADANDLDNNGIADSTESLDTRNRRMKQWMLDAFAAQFSVSAAALKASSQNASAQNASAINASVAMAA